MNVYEWYSYSCNNSSDHRLIATFDTDKKAEAMAKELAAVFLKNAKEMEAADNGEGDGEWDPWDYDPSPALVAFGKKYGGKFTEGLIWGDDGAWTEDLPEVRTLGKDVYVYHGYMSGGFDGDLPGILKKAGAKKVHIESGPSWIKIGVKSKNAKKVGKLQAAIDDFIGQRNTADNLCDWKTPWKNGRLPICRDLDNLVVLHDDDGTTFTIAIGAEGIANLEKWLKSAGADSIEVELTDPKAIKPLKKKEGGTAKTEEKKAADASATIKNPKGLSFMFTGKLASMTRDEAKKRVTKIGGTNAGSVSKTLNVLVIGDDGSPLYGDGAKGDKQRKAEQLNGSGSKIQIISESAFLTLK
jgi:NAD-dependent DNA ligase